MTATTSTEPRARGQLVVVAPSDEEAKLDRAVEHINRIYTAKGLETARAIGEYLLEHFFDGDLDAIHDRGAKAHSFRNLARRADLYPSAPFLYQSVALLEQLRALPDDIAEALPFSHHRLLFPVQDADEKRDLAARAVEQRLSVRDLNALVEIVLQDQPKRSGGGRPRLPKMVKSLRKLGRVVDEVHTAPVPREHLRTLAHRDVEQLLASLDEQILTLSAVRDVLGKCVRG